VGLLGRNDVRVRVQDLFEEGGAGPGVAAQEGQAPPHPECGRRIDPALKRCGGETRLELLKADSQVLELGHQRRNLWGEDGLGLQERGHRLIITALAIQYRAQFISGLYPDFLGRRAGELPQQSLGLFVAASPALQPGADQPGKRAMLVPLQRALHQIERFFEAVQAFVESGQFGPGFGGGVGLLQRAAVVTFGQFGAGKLSRLLRYVGQGLRLIGGHPDGLVEMTFGGGVVVTQPMGAAQRQEDVGVGRIQPAGAFNQIEELLIIPSFPALLRGLEQARHRSRGNQVRSLHRFVGCRPAPGVAEWRGENCTCRPKLRHSRAGCKQAMLTHGA
jgi:hypothetical protein